MDTNCFWPFLLFSLSLFHAIHPVHCMTKPSILLTLNPTGSRLNKPRVKPANRPLRHTKKLDTSRTAHCGNPAVSELGLDTSVQPPALKHCSKQGSGAVSTLPSPPMQLRTQASSNTIRGVGCRALDNSRGPKNRTQFLVCNG